MLLLLKTRCKSVQQNSKAINEIAGGKVVPKWLEFNAENLTGRVASLPSREDIDLPIREHLIVELYSK